MAAGIQGSVSRGHGTKAHLNLADTSAPCPPPVDGGVPVPLTSLVILMRSVAVSEYLPWLLRISALSRAQRSASTMFLPGKQDTLRQKVERWSTAAACPSSDGTRGGEALPVPAGVPVRLDGRVHVVSWVRSGSSGLQKGCHCCHFLEQSRAWMDEWRRPGRG